jgi:pyruvate formate lyase activating enzyme
MGYKIKLDTNGLLYDRLIKMRNIDFIAMDIKTSIDKYNLVCPHFTDSIKQNVLNSIDYIMQSGIDYEFRTTVVPGIVDMDDICHICGKIHGAKKYSLAQFRPKNTLDKSYENVIPYGDTFFTQAKQIVEAAGIECELRVGY